MDTQMLTDMLREKHRERMRNFERDPMKEGEDFSFSHGEEIQIEGSEMEELEL